MSEVLGQFLQRIAICPQDANQPGRVVQDGSGYACQYSAIGRLVTPSMRCSQEDNPNRALANRIELIFYAR